MHRFLLAVVTGTVDPNAVDSQLLKASADSNISDVVLAFPPGSLAIATDISLKEGPSIGSELVLRDLGLASTPTVTNSAAAVEITSSAAIDLKQPMILSLPLPVGFSLAGESLQRQRLGVLYRIIRQSTGEKIVGFVPASELTIDANNKLLFPSLYFGSFQVVVFDQVVAKLERLDTQPTFDTIQYILPGLVLPSCGLADVGKTVFVQDTGLFQTCGAKGWVSVDLKGPQGLAGPQGPAGVAGGVGASRPIGVFDSAGTRIGRYAGTAALHKFFTTLPDGITVSLATDGTISTTTGFECGYVSNDCTGVCYGRADAYSYAREGDYVIVYGPSVGGVGIDFENRKIVALSTTPLTINSNWMVGCSNYPQTYSSYYTSAAYTPTITIIPPIELKTE
ncbi:MAG: hypothetical protein EOP04_22275 [Proteobacteria bacterium]|nr:MAG: hypothetical protein EOP04_22275 [Pseudomonadota bacterium]